MRNKQTNSVEQSIFEKLIFAQLFKKVSAFMEPESHYRVHKSSPLAMFPTPSGRLFPWIRSVAVFCWK